MEDFVDAAEAQRSAGNLQEALKTCLAGLTEQPSNLPGRLLLSRIFFELGYLAFAKRELEELSREVTDSEVLNSLFARFGVIESEADIDDETVAETEIDLEVIDIDDEK
jgi:hypothetical protein